MSQIRARRQPHPRSPARHRRACSSLNAGSRKPVSITSPRSGRAALSGAALRFSTHGDGVRVPVPDPAGPPGAPAVAVHRRQPGGRPRRQCGGRPGPARRLDGIPLALQLPAVLPGSLSLDQLNQRLRLTTLRNDHSDFRVRPAKPVWPRRVIPARAQKWPICAPDCRAWEPCATSTDSAIYWCTSPRDGSH